MSKVELSGSGELMVTIQLPGWIMRCLGRHPCPDCGWWLRKGVYSLHGDDKAVQAKAEARYKATGAFLAAQKTLKEAERAHREATGKWKKGTGIV